MKKNISLTRKSLLYALIGSSLLWNIPTVSYAEDTPEAVPAKEQAATEQTAASEPNSARREFTLEGVEVTADRNKSLSPAYAGGQVARGGSLGILGNKDFMDTPFNLTRYTAQTIEDRQASTLHDVLLNDPSVRFTTSSGHMQENFSIRGLSLLAEDVNFNGMSGLAPRSHTPVEFLEGVEVFKGPASFLNGGVNLSVGGTINLVPKRAGEEDITTFTTDYTSSSQLGGHIDIGRRFGKNKEFGVRFNGVYKDGDTETDGQSKKRLLGALGLDYRQDKWRVSLDAYGSQENYDNGSTVMYDLSKGVIDAPDGSTNLVKGTYGNSRNNGLLFKSEYDLNNKLTAYAGIGKLTSNTTGFLSGNHARNIQADGTAEIYQHNQYWWTEAVSSEVGLRGKYQTGSINHQIVLGSSLVNSESGNGINSSPTSNITNIYHPTIFAITMPSPAKPKKNSEKEFSSLFIADTLSWNEEKVQLTLGMRHQKVNTKGFNVSTGAVTSEYDSNANTPVVGLVVKPWGNSVALYSNYIEGLSPGEVVGAGAQNAGEVLAPYKTKQKEVGVKWDSGDFANTLSLYQITNPSKINIYSTSSLYKVAYDGEQENRGIEWSTFGKIAENVRLLGGISYMQGELVRTANGTTDGNTPSGLPKWQMNIGVEWDTPWNPDLTLSLRAIHTSSQYINNTNTLSIPSWIRYDLGASYKTTIDKTPVTFRASVENVFNKNYWAGSFNSSGYVTLGTPRTVKLSATMQL
ncbi:TonB-dependent receptor [Sporomusa malonica]|uniref:Iron complex outermembrane recepter protein n=1 Tax=Sporomusa malonica TaxID=112901 RepID=A0A1W1ZN88_9FIRM|nr:TonB-dependent siderophore receptor [Sporomusa malonica]SMC49995.1 iron complex outermembrane recepter protein [Sporomusa malonica]